MKAVASRMQLLPHHSVDWEELAVLQALWMTFVGPATMLPAILASSGGLLLLAANRAGHLPEQMQHLWAAIPGWTATGLFMFQPVAQSVGGMPTASCGLSVSNAGHAQPQSRTVAPVLVLVSNSQILWRAYPGHCTPLGTCLPAASRYSGASNRRWQTLQTLKPWQALQ